MPAHCRRRAALAAAAFAAALPLASCARFLPVEPQASSTSIAPGSDLAHYCADAAARPPVGPAEDDAYVVWMDAAGFITGVRPLWDARPGEHAADC